ncbi:hypothetical protein P3X46_018464 [Hevea brasiliensis]|uniref:Mitochondrial carrier protein n=1 Tax=Hevea brasiliensis TaxID=3981 RepID=A0ABQ9LTZ9_HEVBR|nr:hypothetical protein P3X46_018464 [Hevea brasiliensis]
MKKKVQVLRAGSAALNTTKHLWAGIVAVMVSSCLLLRLKLKYAVRAEQRSLFELIKTIKAVEGLKGFCKGNFVNILRIAPFKFINLYAYDTYKNQLLKWFRNKETTNFERFIAGAVAEITATLLCLPMDTIRTKMVAPSGEASGGVIGTFRHMGLAPSIASMAPSGAIFYGVYDILKIQNLKQEGQELSALEQLELGTMRTLLYGAIVGCYSEATTYPFEVVRRHLQMQVRATKMNALATCVKIVDQGAAISCFVYEFMKIVLKVESI